jgi:hypothetical protein
MATLFDSLASQSGFNFPAPLEEDRLQDRFLSRTMKVEFSSYGIAAQTAALLDRIWKAEVNAAQDAAPNFARLVKDSNNNVRESLMSLEREMMAI